MIKQLIVIGLGGALGSIFRYLMQFVISSLLMVVFPLGTFIVNISGYLLIGIFYSAFEKYTVLSEDWRLFFITGICGGYTTFSSFSYESITLFRQGEYLCFFSYVILSVVFGVLATFSGMLIMK